MCLRIKDHEMMCDVRPLVRHPNNPASHIVDPFVVLKHMCSAASPAKPRAGMQCPTHECCRVTVLSFPCGCGDIVEYHRYAPAEIPCAYTINTDTVPSEGVWRKLESLDDISAPEAQAKPPRSEKLEIARRGLMYAAAQLEPVMRELTRLSIREEERSARNRRFIPPYKKQVQAVCDELNQVIAIARGVQMTYVTWMHMKETFERSECSEDDTPKTPN
ncbi:hypothetical protein F4802DRAFT_60251 [Xylaria palmicola]|nr:hypothetical protein F4802DRAFT_60251 [Xylaria palmicola]